MSFRRNVVPVILAGIIPAAALAVLVYLLLLRPGPPPPVDATRAPLRIKEICLSGNIPWRAWSEIVIHHSAGENGDLDLVDRVHRKEKDWQQAGYHFVIGNGTLSGDGEIEVGPRWPAQQDGAHCWGRNTTAIGVCLIGNFDIKNNAPSEAQMKSLLELTAYLAARYDIPMERIGFHNDLADAKKPTRCPGKNFPKEAFRRRLAPLIETYRPAQ